MPIVVPKKSDEILAETFGAPVANQLNAMATRTGGAWRRAASQSVGTGAWVNILWDTEIADTNNFLTPTSATLTIPSGQDGLYVVTLMFYVGLTAALQLLVTGVVDNITGSGDPITGAASVSWAGPLVAGNTLTGRVFQNTGAAVNMNGRLEVWKVGY